MQLNAPTPQLGWHMIATFGKPTYRAAESGWHTLQLGLFKLKRFPGEGEKIGRRHYKGFLLRFQVWFPVDRAL